MQHQNNVLRITAGSSAQTQTGRGCDTVDVTSQNITPSSSSLTCTMLSASRALFTDCYPTGVYAMCYKLVKYLSSFLCKLRMACTCQLLLSLLYLLPSSIYFSSYLLTMCVFTGYPDVTTRSSNSAAVCAAACVELKM